MFRNNIADHFNDIKIWRDFLSPEKQILKGQV